MGGTLDIAVKKNPFGEWDESKGDHHTDLGIEPDEWEQLFFNVLQAPQDVIYFDGEDMSEYYKRRERLFQENLKNKGYEMLGRIWYIYRDASYLPSEINKLLEECLEVQKKTNNVPALSALKKLIIGCNKALEIGSGLRLLSD